MSDQTFTDPIEGSWYAEYQKLWASTEKLRAETSRLRKAADREYRLRQKVRALRKEVRRLNRIVNDVRSGEEIGSLQTKLDALQKQMRETKPIPLYRASEFRLLGDEHLRVQQSPLPVELPPDRPRAS